MKAILRSTLVAAFALISGAAAAQVATFDFDNDYATLFPALPGVSDSNGSNLGDFNEPTTASVSGYSITVSESGKNNPNRIWTSSPRLRMYGGTLTIQAPEGKAMKKIEFVSKTGSAFKWGAANTVDCGEVTADKTAGKATWTGDANKLVVTVDANTQLKSLAIYDEAGGDVTPDTPEPPVSTDLVAPFTLDLKGNEAGFTADNKQLPEGLSYVWTNDSKYGWKASAYVSGTTYAAESWLVSPVITLATDSKLNFHYAANKFSSVDILPEQARLMIQQDGAADWQALTVPVWPASLSWTYIDSGDIDLAQFAGQKVRIAFVYTSTEAGAGTWEIDAITVSGTASAITSAPALSATDAPVYTLSGQRIPAPRKGVNIIGGKKVVVK